MSLVAGKLTLLKLIEAYVRQYGYTHNQAIVAIRRDLQELAKV